jgi:hypothetical protein
MAWYLFEKTEENHEQENWSLGCGLKLVLPEYRA